MKKAKELRKDTPYCIDLEFRSLRLNISVMERFIKLGYSEDMNMTIDEYNDFTDKDMLNQFKETYNDIIVKYGRRK